MKILFLLALLTSACSKKIPSDSNRQQIRICNPSLSNDCIPGIPVGPPVPKIVDMATPDLATPDLSTPDLATPDLATPDLSTPDLATPDLAMPDMGSPPSDMITQIADLTSGTSIDGASCRGNGLSNFWGFPQPPCGADCGPTCQEGAGCIDKSDCTYYMSNNMPVQFECHVDHKSNPNAGDGGTSAPYKYCLK
jgi:hypothetical protein